MIEPIMYGGIGFLCAALLVLGVIPLVHARAVRLTMKRLEAVTPMSMAEIQADKDQLRAEFAMSTRRLEMSVEQMKAKTTSQLAEIGKQAEAVGRLKLELGEKTAELFALEAKEQQLREDLAGVQRELAARTATLEETERSLAETRAELARVTTSFNEASVTTDSQRVELMALRAQVEVFKGQIEGYEKEIADLHSRLAEKTTEAEAATRRLAEEHSSTEGLRSGFGELERKLQGKTSEGEVLRRRVQELITRLDEQGRYLVERERAIEQLSEAAAAAQKKQAQLQAALTDSERRHRSMTETFTTEKHTLDIQLRQVQEERARLLREIETMKREAEAAWAAERTENAAMRERITDVAAEVARLTSLVEGPESPIEAILATEHGHRPLNGNGTAADTESSGKGSLADRIRALQQRAPRPPRAGKMA